MVDSLGLVLKAFVTQADYQDGAVTSWLVPLLPDKFPLPLEAVGRWWLHWRLARQTARRLPNCHRDCPPPAGATRFQGHPLALASREDLCLAQPVPALEQRL